MFTERLNSGDILLTAHHQDDQAETVLLQLLRGAGPKGLSAMPRLKPLGKGFHARPLLDVSREELMRYAQARTLNWIEDESNSNTHYMRNFLRHDILSRLKTRLPTITKTLARVADNCAQVQELLRVTAKQHLQNMLGSSPQQLFVPALLKHDALQQSAILRTWFEELNYPIPSAVKLQQIQQSFLSIRQDKVPHIHWGNVELRRYRDYLYIMPCLVSHDKYRTYEWDLSQSLNLPAIGALQATSQQGQGLRLDIQKVLVRFRQGGEMIQLPGRSHRHEVKKLFQAWGIPSWQRDRIPFIFVGDQLAAIVGWAVDAMFVAEKNAWGQALTLQPFL